MIQFLFLLICAKRVQSFGSSYSPISASILNRNHQSSFRCFCNAVAVSQPSGSETSLPAPTVK